MMKDLKTHLLESIKPPRLSAKNKELWKNGILDEEEVMKWLRKNCIIGGKVEIVNGKINVNGGIIFEDNIECFPYPFGRVTGYFNCSGCKLTTLKNCPEYVDGDFSCSRCINLTSLEGAPKEVDSDFNCFYCSNLTSLEGAPEKVGGNFGCYSCGKKFTKEDVRKVCKVKGVIRV